MLLNWLYNYHMSEMTRDGAQSTANAPDKIVKRCRVKRHFNLHSGRKKDFTNGCVESDWERKKGKGGSSEMARCTAPS